jgi:CRISPR type IV-associated protein Csf3
MTPVRVTFEFRTPMIVPSDVKTLDAIMAWAAVSRAEFYGLENSWASQHETGIAVHRVGEQWCPMASSLEIEWADTQQPIHYIKRQRLEDYARAWDEGLLKKRPAFDASRGLTKAGSYFQSARWVRSARAWAIVSDFAVFEGLLPWVTHVGKLHHKDYGAVRKVEVVADHGAEEKWFYRPLPMGSEHATEQHVPAVGNLCSPYWKRSTFQPILLNGF